MARGENIPKGVVHREYYGITDHMKYGGEGFGDPSELEAGYDGHKYELGDQPPFNYGDLSHASNTRFDQQPGFRGDGAEKMHLREVLPRSDYSIEEEITWKLNSLKEIAIDTLFLSVEMGRVKLSGEVGSEEEIREIHELCREVHGVREVSSELCVRH